ncbi:MAG: S-adenosylmethionine:tRNA ribosyltransferase-isomerase [Bdellovibrionales bacterium]|nr:S-adenosylmethionine:tRNA ribosyltransferase-isomerase [Bdellovibrionales bacterium]
MKISDFSYSYPDSLVATERAMSSRVMFVGAGNRSPTIGPVTNPRELNLSEARDLLGPGDLLVLNDTGVIPCRIFTPENREILFVCRESPDTWQVLFPARGLALGKKMELPGGRIATLVRKGLPQILKIEGEELLPRIL